MAIARAPDYFQSRSKVIYEAFKNMKTQKSIHADSIGRSLQALSLVLLCAIAGPLALLSTGCTATEGRNSYLSSDQHFYHPPRDPQFNKARDQ
jgi:hypothetical protein